MTVAWNGDGMRVSRNRHGMGVTGYRYRVAVVSVVVRAGRHPFNRADYLSLRIHRSQPCISGKAVVMIG